MESSLKRLQITVNDAADAADDDDVIRALAQLLVIRACGYVEQVAEECCRAYLMSKSNPRANAFAASWLGRGRNPSPESLVDLVGRFDLAWASEFRRLLDEEDQRLSRELSYLVDRRNKIAHGINEGVSITKAASLSTVAQEVADWFVLRLDPR